jgi:hypothetical protein
MGKMTKQCAICGVEKNIFLMQNLKDGNYICRSKCMKLGAKFFEYAKADVEEAKAHHAQVERGARLWDRFFVPRLKPTDKSMKLKIFRKTSMFVELHGCYVAEDVGLVAIRESRSAFVFGKKTGFTCVYPLADLRMYDFIKSTTGNGKQKSTAFFINFFFTNAQGMRIFRVPFRKGNCKKIVRYFDGLFGLETKGSWGQKFDTMKGVGSLLKSAMKGELPKDPAAMKNDEEIENVFRKLGKLKEGDRTAWAQKSDAALIKKELNKLNYQED